MFPVSHLISSVFLHAVGVPHWLQMQGYLLWQLGKWVVEHGTRRNSMRSRYYHTCDSVPWYGAKGKAYIIEKVTNSLLYTGK